MTFLAEKPYQENDPMNTQAPRMIDAIYLRPMTNEQGGHELMNLATGNVIKKNKIWEMPATELVIKAVEKLAEKQGITSLKITGQHSRRLTLTTWTPGVDDNPDDDDGNEEYENNQDDQEDEEYNKEVEQEEIDELLNEGCERNDPKEPEHEIVFENENKNEDENDDDAKVMSVDEDEDEDEDEDNDDNEEEEENNDKQEESTKRHYLTREWNPPK